MAAKVTRYALMDPVTPTAALFQCASKTKGPSRLHATRVQTRHAGFEITFVCPYALGSDDWRVLVTLVALAGIDQDEVSPQDEARQTTLEQVGAAARSPTLRVTATAYALLREGGLSDNGANRAGLSRSLERLSSVTQTIRKGDKIFSGGRFLAFHHDEDTGRLVALLSADLVRAVLGTATQYARISLVEVRAIGRNSPALILHAYLSSRLRPGASFTFNIGTLVRAAYPASSDTPPATVRQYRRSVRAALMALPATWSVTLAGSRVTVQRATLADLVQWEEEIEAVRDIQNPRLPARRHPDLPTDLGFPRNSVP